MTLPRTVAGVLSDHVTFEVEGIDRMYLNVYVPQLQHAGGLLGYVQRQLGLRIASTAPLARSPTVSPRRCTATPSGSRSRGWTLPGDSAKTT